MCLCDLRYYRLHAGRGPLAGPVVAAACFLPPHVKIDGIIDSKATKEEDREVTYEQLTTTDGVLWGISIVSHTKIDELNILQASLKAMSTAVKDLISKSKTNISAFDVGNCHILVDGNKVPSDLPDDALSKIAVVKGDSRIYSIAAASIIAKVTRDRLMVEMDKQFPIYGFAQHKGYPTAAHRSILMEHGPCPTHRLSYGPVLAAARRHGVLLPAPAEAATGNEAVPSKRTGENRAKGAVVKKIKQKERDQEEGDSSLPSIRTGVGKERGRRVQTKEGPNKEEHADKKQPDKEESAGHQGGGKETRRRKRSPEEKEESSTVAVSEPKKAKKGNGKTIASSAAAVAASAAPLRRSIRLKGSIDP